MCVGQRVNYLRHHKYEDEMGSLETTSTDLSLPKEYLVYLPQLLRGVHTLTQPHLSPLDFSEFF